MLIYHSNFTEYKEYTTISGVVAAYKRYLIAHPDCLNLVTVLHEDEEFANRLHISSRSLRTLTKQQCYI